MLGGIGSTVNPLCVTVLQVRQLMPHLAAWLSWVLGARERGREGRWGGREGGRQVSCLPGCTRTGGACVSDVQRCCCRDVVAVPPHKARGSSFTTAGDTHQPSTPMRHTHFPTFHITITVRAPSFSRGSITLHTSGSWLGPGNTPQSSHLTPHTLLSHHILFLQPFLPVLSRRATRTPIERHLDQPKSSRKTRRHCQGGGEMYESFWRGRSVRDALLQRQSEKGNIYGGKSTN